MAPPSPIRFIETALSCTGPFAVSYTDPDQKWLIRKHLISLIQNFPNLSPSVDPFFHDNGSTVNLLNVRGYLHVSQSTPPIPINIWLHETTLLWLHLCLSHQIPPPQSMATILLWILPVPPPPLTSYTGTTLIPISLILSITLSSSSPMTTLLCICQLQASPTPHLYPNRKLLTGLPGRLHYDIAAIRAKTAEEIEELSALQGEMVKRVGIATSIVMGLIMRRRS
ncbi:Protein ELC [Vitis vinifera]|uniref:Protein ELC n=1 Tax=Vitis vinifera TaxID=29760 RepID=A0A438F413_VITVI|nr:Protein ELC [Vitis vinifera]